MKYVHCVAAALPVSKLSTLVDEYTVLVDAVESFIPAPPPVPPVAVDAITPSIIVILLPALKDALTDGIKLSISATG